MHGCALVAKQYVDNITHTLGEGKMHKEERDVLEEMRKIDEYDTEKIDTLDGSEKTIVTLGDRWWPQTAKQEGDKVSKKHLCNVWTKCDDRPNVGGVSIRSRNGASFVKGRVVNGQMAKATTNEYVSPVRELRTGKEPGRWSSVCRWINRGVLRSTLSRQSIVRQISPRTPSRT